MKIIMHDNIMHRDVKVIERSFSRYANILATEGERSFSLIYEC